MRGVLALVAVIGAGGCGGVTGTGVATSGGGATGTGGAETSGGSAALGIGGLEEAGGFANDRPGACPGTSLEAEQVPVDIYVMFDQSEQISDLALLARTAFETEPKVRTFVIGINLGVAGRALDSIAKAGGTEKAMLVEAGNLEASFVDAMLSIPGRGGGCSLDIPKQANPNPPADPTLIDVRYTPSATGVTRHVTQLNSLGDCDAAGGEGWYYDSPDAPTKIELCTGICSARDLGVVEVVVGCHPIACIPK